MTIRDVFAFTSGATVFTGEVEDAPNFIGPCNCELAVEGRGPTRLRIEGDMFHAPPGQRALSTVDPVDVPLVRSALGRCWLRELPPSKG